MKKPKKKLTSAQKAAKKKRQNEYMTVFMNGKQKRIKRPPAIDGISVDNFINNNADPIWLHQNETWEHIAVDEDDSEFKNKIPSTPSDWLREISKAYLDAFEAIPFGIFVGQKLTPKDLFHLGPELCLKSRGIKRTKTNLKKAAEAALSSYVATEELVGDLFNIPQISFSFSYIASHYGLNLIDEYMATKLLEYIEDNIGNLLKLTNKNM